LCVVITKQLKNIKIQLSININNKSVNKMTEYFKEGIDLNCNETLDSPTFDDVLIEIKEDELTIKLQYGSFINFDDKYIISKNSEEYEAIEYLNNYHNELVKSDYNYLLLIDYLKKFIYICEEYPIIARLTADTFKKK
jgi:hypothetical protein